MTTRTISAMLLLVAACITPARGQKPDTEEKTLSTVRDAVDQIDSWRNASLYDVYIQAAAGNLQAQALSRQLDQTKEKYGEWEQLEWVPTLGTNETLEMLLTGEAGIKGPFNGQVGIHFVQAPPGIAAHILMEKMRWEISDTVELYKFSHRPISNDALISAWQVAWAWARDIYCDHNPRSKFTNLNREEQVCQEPLNSSAQVKQESVETSSASSRTITTFRGHALGESWHTFIRSEEGLCQITRSIENCSQAESGDDAVLIQSGKPDPFDKNDHSLGVVSFQFQHGHLESVLAMMSGPTFADLSFLEKTYGPPRSKGSNPEKGWASSVWRFSDGGEVHAEERAKDSGGFIINIYVNRSE